LLQNKAFPYASSEICFHFGIKYKFHHIVMYACQHDLALPSLCLTRTHRPRCSFSKESCKRRHHLIKGDQRMTHFASDIVKLPQLNVEKGQSSVSGLSSGAFMTVQLHLAHSASFTGAGVIAGGPYRGVETFRGSALITEDAWEINAMQLCMAPLTPELAPDARKSVQLAQQTERDLLIDPLSNMARQRMYIFTGSKDSVVMSPVVAQTREMYRLLGVPEAQIQYDDSVPAGHSLLTANPEDNALGDNKPPYLNRGPLCMRTRSCSIFIRTAKPLPSIRPVNYCALISAIFSTATAPPV
jgi:hypothetical protein